MSLPDAILEQMTSVLSRSAGTPVRVLHRESLATGWSAQFETYPWVTRCRIEERTGKMPASVIVKVRRPAIHRYRESFRLDHERAALEFLTSIGCTAGPRLLAADREAGLIIMEDLGTGLALEDLLVGHDASLASDALVAFAATLAQMHAATLGRAERYYQLRGRFGSVDPAFDRVSILGISIEHSWSQVQQIATNLLHLPAPDAVGKDVKELLHILSEPGPLLALSNGDTSPANCRISEEGLRFLDFEHACFRHVLLDVAALRFPFPACGCWSRLPEAVSQRAEEAYRKQMALACPELLDANKYSHGMAVACAAWTIIRAVRLPKLDQIDVPHPMSFSRRGQLLDTIATTLHCCEQSGRLPALASWLASVSDALRARWSPLASVQPFYPAFQPYTLGEAHD